MFLLFPIKSFYVLIHVRYDQASVERPRTRNDLKRQGTAPFWYKVAPFCRALGMTETVRPSYQKFKQFGEHPLKMQL